QGPRGQDPGAGQKAPVRRRGPDRPALRGLGPFREGGRMEGQAQGPGGEMIRGPGCGMPRAFRGGDAEARGKNLKICEAFKPRMLHRGGSRSVVPQRGPAMTEETIYIAALEKADPAERAAYLEG